MTRHPRLSDAGVLAITGCAALGAYTAWPLPRWPALAALVMALARRRPLLLALGVLVLANAQAHDAWRAVEPAPAHAVDDVVTLLTDPRPVGRSVTAQVRHQGRRYTIWIEQGRAGEMLDRLAGEQLAIVGQTRPRSADQRWLALRGVVGEIDVDRVRWWRPGSPVTRLANGLRRTLLAGVDHLDPDQTSLLTGFVLGDDRFQSALVTDDFRGSGLGHLLAVSGQNVAFVLVLAGPLLSRLEFRHRLPVTLAVIAFFALLTRFEPSVIRASAMAALSASAAAAGRPTRGIRLLGLAVTAVIIAAPLLVYSLAFQLSVLASAGIMVIGPAVAASLPGPRNLALAAGVTVGAQLAVSPLLLATFGEVPVASLPANLLAGPAAGPISAWALTAGLVAGIVGGPVAVILHIPTVLLVGWVATVAAVAARLPLGSLGWPHLGLAVGAAVLARFGSGRAARTGAAALLITALIAPAVVLAHPPVWVSPVAGVDVWRRGGAVVVVVDSTVRPAAALAALRSAGIGPIDVLALSGRARGAGELIGALVRRHRIGAVWAGSGGSALTMVPRPGSIAVGGLEVTVHGVDPALLVSVGLPRPDGVGRAGGGATARAPPIGSTPRQGHETFPGISALG